MTSSISQIDSTRGSSAFVSKNGEPTRPVRSKSLDQEVGIVFNGIQRRVSQERGVQPGSPFQTIPHTRPRNPQVPDIGNLISRLPESKSEVLVRSEALLNLLFSQEKAVIENGIGNFLEWYDTFNQGVPPVESSSQEVFQMESGHFVSDISILRLSKKMVEDQKSKLAALNEIGQTDNQKIEDYANKLREYSVGYTDPDIRIFIEEQKTLHPESSFILSLEKANGKNEEVNKTYNFLKLYFEYDL